MIGSLPPRPTGSGPQARFFQWLWDQFASQQLTTRTVPGARVSRTTRGTFVEPDGSGGGGTGRVRKFILQDAAAADYLKCRPWNEAYWTSRRDIRQEKGKTAFDLWFNHDSAAAPVGTYRDDLAARMAVTREVLDAYLGDLTADPPVPAQLVVVAKPPELRADALDGYEIDEEVETWVDPDLTTATRTLSYDYHSSTLRTATDVTDDPDGPNELELIIPRYVAEESIIHAIGTITEMTVAAAAVTLLDINTAGRAWMRAT